MVMRPPDSFVLKHKRWFIVTSPGDEVFVLARRKSPIPTFVMFIEREFKILPGQNPAYPRTREAWLEAYGTPWSIFGTSINRSNLEMKYQAHFRRREIQPNVAIIPTKEIAQADIPLEAHHWMF